MPLSQANGERPQAITSQEIAAAFTSGTYAEKFPPLLSVAQAAELFQVPKGTIYDWSSRGLLENCSLRAGKYLRIWRDRFILSFANQG